VPRLGAARAWVWAALAALALRPLVSAGQEPDLSVVRQAGGCGLAVDGTAPPCACGDWPAALRRVLELPLPLNRASAADLETLSGVGPGRAAAIVAERARNGPFGSPGELARVHGIGTATAERLSPALFSQGPDPACRAGLPGNPG
jgi:competence protein ComEA